MMDRVVFVFFFRWTTLKLLRKLRYSKRISSRITRNLRPLLHMLIDVWISLFNIWLRVAQIVSGATLWNLKIIFFFSRLNTNHEYGFAFNGKPSNRAGFGSHTAISKKRRPFRTESDSDVLNFAVDHLFSASDWVLR